MSFAQAVFLFVAAFVAGALNAVAGGGSFISFPALLFTAMPPINANATNTAALWPGTVASAGAYRRELTGEIRKLLTPLVAASLLGGWLGAGLLLRTRQATFMRLVPWLLLVATLLFASSGRVSAWIRAHSVRLTGSTRLAMAGGVLLQLLIAVYIGFFGAGVGILVLAMLALMGVQSRGDHRLYLGESDRLAAGAADAGGRDAWRLWRRLLGTENGPSARPPICDLPWLRDVALLFRPPLKRYDLRDKWRGRLLPPQEPRHFCAKKPVSPVSLEVQARGVVPGGFEQLLAQTPPRWGAAAHRRRPEPVFQPSPSPGNGGVEQLQSAFPEQTKQVGECQQMRRYPGRAQLFQPVELGALGEIIRSHGLEHCNAAARPGDAADFGRGLQRRGKIGERKGAGHQIKGFIADGKLLCISYGAVNRRRS